MFVDFVSFEFLFLMFYLLQIEIFKVKIKTIFLIFCSDIIKKLILQMT